MSNNLPVRMKQIKTDFFSFRYVHNSGDWARVQIPTESKHLIRPVQGSNPVKDPNTSCHQTRAQIISESKFLIWLGQGPNPVQTQTLHLTWQGFNFCFILFMLPDKGSNLPKVQTPYLFRDRVQILSRLNIWCDLARVLIQPKTKHFEWLSTDWLLLKTHYFITLDQDSNPDQDLIQEGVASHMRQNIKVDFSWFVSRPKSNIVGF